jgi:hypothetical protein
MSDLTMCRFVVQPRYNGSTTEVMNPPPITYGAHVASFDEEIVFYQGNEESVFYIKGPPEHWSAKVTAPKGIGGPQELKSLPQSNGLLTDHPPCDKLNPTPSASHCTSHSFFCSSVFLGPAIRDQAFDCSSYMLRDQSKRCSAGTKQPANTCSSRDKLARTATVSVVISS